jgi:hypothetical protein
MLSKHLLKRTISVQLFWFPEILSSVSIGLVLAIFWLTPLLFGNYINHGVDVVSHYSWSKQFSSAIFEGVIQPQWLSENGYGFGKPDFVTYSPAFYYIAALGKAITGDVWLGMKFSSLFFLTMCGTFVHLLLRKIVSRSYAFFGTFTVLSSPMVIASLYNYTGFPTFASFGPMAAVIYFTFRDESKSRISLGLAVSFCVLTLTHILSAGLLAIVLGSGLLANTLIDTSHKNQIAVWHNFFYWTISALIGFLLSSFYLIDALIYSQGYLILDKATSDFIDWRRSFSFPIVTQFIHEIYWKTFQWYVPVVYLFGILNIFFYLKNSRFNANNRVSIIFISSLFALFLTSEISYPLWNYISYLQVVQWPWRVLITLALIVPIGVVVIISAAENRFLLKLVGISFLLLCVLFSAAKLSQLVIENKVYDVLDLYEPERHLTKYAESLDYVLQYRDSGGFISECRKHQAICSEINIRSHQKSWRIKTTSSSFIRLPVFYYPGWRLSVNNLESTLNYDEKTGLIKVGLGEGENQLELQWVGVPTRWIGNLISSLTLALIMWVWIWRRYETNNK